MDYLGVDAALMRAYNMGLQTGILGGEASYVGLHKASDYIHENSSFLMPQLSSSPSIPSLYNDFNISIFDQQLQYDSSIQYPQQNLTQQTQNGQSEEAFLIQLIDALLSLFATFFQQQPPVSKLVDSSDSATDKTKQDNEPETTVTTEEGEGPAVVESQDKSNDTTQTVIAPTVDASADTTPVTTTPTAADLRYATPEFLAATGAAPTTTTSTVTPEQTVAPTTVTESAADIEKAKQIGDDVTDIYNAINHVGLNGLNDVLPKVLFEKGYTNEELEEIIAMLEEKQGNSLEDVVYFRYCGEAANILLAKIDSVKNYTSTAQSEIDTAKQMGADVVDLYNAMNPAGTDEAAVRKVLFERGYKKAELVEIMDMFQEKYGKSLEDMIKGDYSGDAEKLLLATLKDARDNAGQS